MEEARGELVVAARATSRAFFKCARCTPTRLLSLDATKTCASSTPVAHQTASRSSPLAPLRQNPIVLTAASADMIAMSASSSFKGAREQSNAHMSPSTLGV